jgi:hypothetical protein
MEAFKNVKLYDWVDFFKSISKAIDVIGQDKVNRNDILKEKAKLVFGQAHYICNSKEIDPLSFIYSLAQKNTVNQKVDTFQACIDAFDLKTNLPTDWYFPTPTPNTKSLFYFMGDYVDDYGKLVSADVLWSLFSDAVNGKDLSADDFNDVLSIKNVGVVKLTQTLFIINAEKFLPIDERTITILPNSINPIKEIKNLGLPKYEELLNFYRNKFPECFGYEINLFLSQFTGKGKHLTLNDNFCQVSSMVDGQNKKDYYDDFIASNSVRAGSSGDHKTRGGEYPLDKVFDGDIVLVRRGTKNTGGIGVIIHNEYLENGYDDDKSIKIVWINKSKRKLTTALGDWNGFNLATPNTLSKFKETYSDTFELIDFLTPIKNTPTDIVNSNSGNMKTNNLNQILYGPPGTGKTYNTINKALSILETKTEEEINTEERDVLKARFDDYIKNGQIVFTTFHQSMSYEDFIEGIKPLKPEDEDEFVKYDIEEGIFKGLCRQAIKEFYQKGTNDETFERLNSFENAWNDLLENVQFSIDNNVVFPLDTKSGQAMDAFEISNRGNLYLKPQYEGGKDYTVSHDRAQKLFEAFPNLEVVNNIDKEFRDVIGGSNSTAYWSVLNYIISWLNENPTAPSIKQTTEISDTLVKFDNKIVKDNISSSVLNYVLIIDEINRGNVSQIFGELITLIEEDKRLGKDEALEVMLPYSKEKFGVPPNLYIVGTMNTADRSVEALDTALRRRFSFEEMPPKTKVVEEKEFSDYPRVAIMEKINNRIEVLLDRNHTLGHAYFIKKNFKSSFENEIIPLLQEYFYNDYGKIGLVLGKGFVREKAITAKNDKSIFADFDTKNDVDINKSYELIPFPEVDFDTAIQTLLV